MNKKIYIVTSGEYSDYGIDAVFSSKELAKNTFDKFVLSILSMKQKQMYKKMLATWKFICKIEFIVMKSTLASYYNPIITFDSWINK